MKKVPYLLAGLFCFCWICLMVQLPCEAAEHRNLTVGYIDYHGFIDEDIDGTYLGYGVDYLNEIAEYTGYTYSYEYGSWAENLEKLKNHEIDLICTAQYTQERAERYVYSRAPIGNTQGLLYATKESELVYEDFSSFNGMKIAVLKENAMNGLFDNYAKDNGFTYEMVEYSDTQACIDALEDGEVDAVVGESLLYNDSLKLIANFGADPFYIISYKGADFMEEIDYALSEIKRDENFEADLFSKYYGTSVVASTAEFTQEEKEYIQKSDSIVVGSFQESAPLFYTARDTGDDAGIYVDLLEEISEISGLQFELRKLDRNEKPKNAMMTGKFDMVLGVERSNFNSDPDILSSDVILESDVVAVVREEKLDIDLYKDQVVAAIPKGYETLWNHLEKSYSNIELIGYNSNQECMEAVFRKDADVFFQNSMVISELLKNPFYNSMAMIPISVMQVENVAITTDNANDQILMRIINKSLYSMEESRMQAIVINNTDAVQYEYTAVEFFYKYRTMIGIGVVISVVVVGLLLSIIYVKRKSERKLKAANQKLIGAIEVAQNANRAKSDFLSRMSHDIRTPMNSIIGTTELAYGELKRPENLKRYLDDIQDSSEFLLGLINDVLDMSMIENGRLKLNPEPYQYLDLVHNVETMFAPICKEKGITFQYQHRKEDFCVYADRLRLNQIFFNILSNAVKFTECHGHVTLREENTKIDSDCFVTDFVFEDDGMGMSKEYQAHLFEPFSQEKNSLTNQREGSGLGLSIVKSLVDSMGGTITVDSEPGRGTKVVVHLGLPIQRKKNRQRIEQDHGEIEEKLRGRRVLLVEDHELNARIASRLLEKKEMEVVIAEDGKCAVDIFNEAAPGTFDVILMDIRMPRMDGLEATRCIRRSDRPDAASIPIIAMTADAFLEDMKTAREAGMNEHLAKPIQTQELYSMLARFMV